jgi:endonuclease-3
LGLTKSKSAEKVEQELIKIFEREEWNDMSLRLIFHGRYRCKSKNPLCYLDPEWSKICSCVEERTKK